MSYSKVWSDKVEEKQYKSLSEKEKKIFDSIRKHFPNTQFGSAYNKAIEGGVDFQFINK